MGGLSIAFGTVVSALEANQQAINVTANNVGNANTPGYTRETVTFQQNNPISLNGLQIGTGVSVSAVTSQRSLILNQAIDQQQQTLSAATSRQAGLTSVENIFNQVATSTSSSGSGGIGGALSGFFNSLSALAASPSQSSSRTGFLSSAQALAASFNSAASQLSSTTTSLNLQVGTTVQQINGLTTTLASLNQQIAQTSPNGDAGALEDQRQQALSQLSQLVDVNQIQTQ